MCSGPAPVLIRIVGNQTGREDGEAAAVHTDPFSSLRLDWWVVHRKLIQMENPTTKTHPQSTTVNITAYAKPSQVTCIVYYGNMVHLCWGGLVQTSGSPA